VYESTNLCIRKLVGIGRRPQAQQFGLVGETPAGIIPKRRGEPARLRSLPEPIKHSVHHYLCPGQGSGHPKQLMDDGDASRSRSRRGIPRSRGRRLRIIGGSQDVGGDLSGPGLRGSACFLLNLGGDLKEM
jgi:hypothetical protein